jgi:hypothetical protein
MGIENIQKHSAELNRFSALGHRSIFPLVDTNGQAYALSGGKWSRVASPNSSRPCPALLPTQLLSEAAPAAAQLRARRGFSFRAYPVNSALLLRQAYWTSEKPICRHPPRVPAFHCGAAQRAFEAAYLSLPTEDSVRL